MGRSASAHLRGGDIESATVPPGSSGFITFGLSGGRKWAPGPTVLTVTLHGPHVLQSLLGHRVRVSLPQSEGLRSHQATSLLLPGPLTASGTPEPTPIPPAAPWVGDTCSPLLRPPDARPLTMPVASDGVGAPGPGLSGRRVSLGWRPCLSGPRPEALWEMVLHMVPLNRQACDNPGQQSTAEVTGGDRRTLRLCLLQAPRLQTRGEAVRSPPNQPGRQPTSPVAFPLTSHGVETPSWACPTSRPVTGSKMAAVLSHRGVQSEGMRPSAP